MISGILLALAQTAAPSVGDTVWVERSVGPIRGAVVRPQPWSLGSLGQQLGPPQVRVGAGGTLVRYALVFWYPGDHSLKMPGPVVVYADGRSDTLAVQPVRMIVGSVLPAGSDPSRLKPSPATTPLPLESRTLRPLVLLLLAAGLILGGAALLWRRRGRVRPRPVPAPTDPPGNVLRQWVRAGEFRAALHELAWMLAGRLKLSEDLEETAALQQVLEEIAFTSFEPHPPARLAALCERAARLAGV